jgi:hypothetical protein
MISLPSVFLPRVFFAWHSANNIFVECPKENTRQIIWHSAKSQITVVNAGVVEAGSSQCLMVHVCLVVANCVSVCGNSDR